MWKKEGKDEGLFRKKVKWAGGLNGWGHLKRGESREKIGNTVPPNLWGGCGNDRRKKKEEKKGIPFIKRNSSGRKGWKSFNVGGGGGE